MDEASIMHIVSTLIYGVLGLILFIAALFILEKITHFSIDKKIAEENNIALAIVIGSIIIAIGMISSAAIR